MEGCFVNCAFDVKLREEIAGICAQTVASKIAWKAIA